MSPGAVFAAWADGGSMRLDLLTHDLPALGKAIEDRWSLYPTASRWAIMRLVCEDYGARAWFEDAEEGDREALPPAKVLLSLPDECPKCKGQIKEWYRREQGFNPGVVCQRGHFTQGDFGPPAEPEQAKPLVVGLTGIEW